MAKTKVLICVRNESLKLYISQKRTNTSGGERIYEPGCLINQGWTVPSPEVVLAELVMT